MNSRPQHWLRQVMPKNASALAIAEKIEDADERVANLKLQIIAVQEARKKLEQNAHELANQVLEEDQDQWADTVASTGLNSAAIVQAENLRLIESCLSTTAILQMETHRLFADATPFLSELVAPELEKVNATSSNLSRWKALCER